MKPTTCIAKNFGSFRDLEFDFSDLGLALFSGQTGAGKSTLADLLPYALLGTTSKAGNADDVRNWSTDEKTSVEQTVETPAGTLTVTRIRGKASQNDLYWVEATDPETKIRGKDATETQKLLCARLGIDAELYGLSGHFSEYSDAYSFFNMKPAQRREMLEKISDLETPVLLAERASEARKATKRDLETWQGTADRDTGALVQMKAQLETNTAAVASWEVRHARDLAATQAKADAWSEDLLRQICTAEAKSTAWAKAHAAARQMLQTHCDAFDTDKAAKIAKLLSNMEATAAAFADLPNVEEIRQTLQERKVRLEEGKQHRQERKVALAAISAKYDQLKATYLKFSTNKGICPECLGPACNDNSAAFLAKTSTEMVDLASDKAAVIDLIEQLTAALKCAEDSLGTETERAEALGRRSYTLERQLENDAAALETVEGLTNYHFALLEKHDTATNPCTVDIKHIKAQSNPHLTVLAKVSKDANPYTEQTFQIGAQIAAQEKTVADDSMRLQGLQHRIASLTTLYDVSFALRGELLRNSVKTLERGTNQRLEDFFDGEFRVAFSLDDDKLIVSITKGGYDCRYVQLSTGQKRMLVISFFFALRGMALDKAGIELGVFVGDEILNGLSSELKVNAYRMFEALSNEVGTVLLIDHDTSFKACFDRKFEVTLNGDESGIHELES